MWQDLTPDDLCRVTAYGRVAGAVPPVYYQLQAYTASGEADGVGLVLLAAGPGGRGLHRLDGWSGSEAFVDVPGIVRTRQGPLMVVPMQAAATAHPADDVVLRAQGGRWRLVDTQSWLNGIAIPKGTAQLHGNAFDWPGLRAYGVLSKPGDSNCCPTGGSYIATLRLDGTRLKLLTVKFAPSDQDFP